MDVLQRGVQVMDERALIDRAQAGNAAAFAELFDEYQRPITNYIYRMVHDREAAEDLTQDTFLKAYRAVGRTGVDLNFRAWLYRIATNTAISYLRHKRLLRWLPFTPSTPEPVADPRLAEQVSESEMIDAVLKEIGPTHSSVLLLRHYQGMSLDEVGKTLGITTNAAKVRLFRARKAFAQAYEALASTPGEERAR